MARTSAYDLQIGTDSEDANATILLADGALVAVLVELSDESHGDDRGRWVVEATFGLRNGRIPESFPSRESAANWISSNICGAPFLIGNETPRLG